MNIDEKIKEVIQDNDLELANLNEHNEIKEIPKGVYKKDYDMIKKRAIKFIKQIFLDSLPDEKEYNQQQVEHDGGWFHLIVTKIDYVDGFNKAIQEMKDRINETT